MALSFPTSPTSGQVYAAPNGVNYTWNSTAGVWTASGAGSGGSVAAWVNFDGTNGSIRGSGNVSSVVRNSTGNYTVNFTTTLASANYASPVSSDSSGFTTTTSPLTYSTTFFTMDVQQFGSGPVDRGTVTVTIIL
jgi:hypothetical protein